MKNPTRKRTNLEKRVHASNTTHTPSYHGLPLHEDRSSTSLQNLRQDGSVTVPKTPGDRVGGWYLQAAKGTGMLAFQPLCDALAAEHVFAWQQHWTNHPLVTNRAVR